MIEYLFFFATRSEQKLQKQNLNKGKKETRNFDQLKLEKQTIVKLTRPKYIQQFSKKTQKRGHFVPWGCNLVFQFRVGDQRS